MDASTRKLIMNMVLNGGLGAVAGGGLMGIIGSKERDSAKRTRNIHKNMLLGALLGGTAGVGITAAGSLLQSQNNPFWKPYATVRGLTQQPLLAGGVAGTVNQAVNVARDKRVSAYLNNTGSYEKNPIEKQIIVPQHNDPASIDTGKRNVHTLERIAGNLAKSPTAIAYAHSQQHVTPEEMTRLRALSPTALTERLAGNREILGDFGKQIPFLERMRGRVSKIVGGQGARSINQLMAVPKLPWYITAPTRLTTPAYAGAGIAASALSNFLLDPLDQRVMRSP